MGLQREAILDIERILGTSDAQSGKLVDVKVLVAGGKPVVLEIPTELLAAAIPFLQDAVQAARAKAGQYAPRAHAMATHAIVGYEPSGPLEICFRLRGDSEFRLTMDRLVAAGLIEALRVALGGQPHKPSLAQ